MFDQDLARSIIPKDAILSTSICQVKPFETEQLRMREFSEPIAVVHQAALLDAGFDQVDTIWQRYDNRILVAVRGQPTAPIQN